MLSPNTRLKDRYRILDKVGGGGFGNIYKAIDEVFGCTVAIKETKEMVSGLDQLRKAFEREAKLLRNLKHESLPRVTDYFFVGEAQYLVMDFVEGDDLAVRLNRRLGGGEGPFTAPEILPWADKILSALEYLHTHPEPIIHRDIKPANIKLTEDGEIYLLDFGLAKGFAGQMSTMRDGQSILSVAAFTHEYAPLEQLQGTGTQPQSDIYACGATLYHLLTAQLPISASMRDEATQRGQDDPLKPAHEVNPKIPLSVSAIISQAMTVRWWDRLASAKEMRVALLDVAEKIPPEPGPTEPDSHPVPSAELIQHKDTRLGLQPQGSPLQNESVPTTPTRSIVKPVRSHRPWLTASVALVVLAVAGVAAWLAFSRWFAPAVSTKAITEVSSSGNPKTLPLITSGDLRPKPPLNGHQKWIWSIAFSHDGNLAASGSEDKTIILWDTNTWKPKFPTLTGHNSPVYSVAFSPDGKTLASAGRDPTIMLWDTETGNFIKRLQENTKAVFTVAFSPVDSGGKVIASIGGSKPKDGGDEIRLWYESIGWHSKTLPLNGPDKMYAIAFSPDGKNLTAAGYGKAIRIWNLENWQQTRDLPIDQRSGGFISRLSFSADGKYLAAASNDGSIKMWGTEKWEELEPLGKEQTEVITAIAFSPDSSMLVSASSDKTIRLWNIATRTSKLLAGGGISRALAFSPDGQTLLSAGADGMIGVWQLQSSR